MAARRAPLRIAALVKQVPRFEAMTLGPDGRLVREGLELEMNPYCRRAVSKGVELARETDGSCTVLTLGPPAATDVLREAIAWGADAGVLITDPACGGSDTLATARALAAALARLGPFDLVLAGRNSVDADTGQVGPEIAELLDLPFATSVRELTLGEGAVEVKCEHDDGWMRATVQLPALLSVAERLCEPAKVDPDGRAAVPAERIQVLCAADLGPGPWGQAGSPTTVEDVRVLEVVREGLTLGGTIDEQVRRAVDLLMERGAFDGAEGADGAAALPARARGAARSPVVAVLVEPERSRITRELLGGAATMASVLGGEVVAVVTTDDGAALARYGADRAVEIRGAAVEEDVAGAVAGWVGDATPWAVLAPSTAWGREVASRVAARAGAGLTGDAVGLEVDGGRLVAWKPAFGGALVAAIRCSTPVQMATVRAGMLPLLAPRAAPPEIPVDTIEIAARGRVVVHERARDDDLDALATARVIVAVGTGVPPGEYDDVKPLLAALGAEMAATRKVTDKAWMPRSRQVGITGRSVAPRLYVALGVAGKFNHMVGTRGAGTVLAINNDPGALVFGASDIGIVGDWREVVPALVAQLAARGVAG
jgi:electron transfer flavoprotein alpha subunit